MPGKALTFGVDPGREESMEGTRGKGQDGAPSPATSTVATEEPVQVPPQGRVLGKSGEPLQAVPGWPPRKAPASSPLAVQAFLVEGRLGGSTVPLRAGSQRAPRPPRG